MAIDFMIMPISRYISGDYITPAMRYSWNLGTPYVIFGPQGKQEFPINLPFGGAGASERRLQILDMVLEDLAHLPPEVSGRLWDERSNEEPQFFRVNPGSYGALQEEATVEKSRGSIFGFFKKSESKLTHLSAQVFLPNSFRSPFEMETPIHTNVGSSEMALKELNQNKWAENSMEAVETLKAALKESTRLALPMIVDL